MAVLGCIIFSLALLFREFTLKHSRVTFSVSCFSKIAFDKT